MGVRARKVAWFRPLQIGGNCWPFGRYNARMIALVLAVALAKPILIQGEPWNSVGSITSRQLTNERRDDNGNVVGTEFYTYKYTVSLRLERTAEVKEENTPR